MSNVSPEFQAAVDKAFAPIEEMIEQMWEQLDALKEEEDAGDQ